MGQGYKLPNRGAKGEILQNIPLLLLLYEISFFYGTFSPSVGGCLIYLDRYLNPTQLDH